MSDHDDKPKPRPLVSRVTGGRGAYRGTPFHEWLEKRLQKLVEKEGSPAGLKSLFHLQEILEEGPPPGFKIHKCEVSKCGDPPVGILVCTATDPAHINNPSSPWFGGQYHLVILDRNELEKGQFFRIAFCPFCGQDLKPAEDSE